MHLKPIHNILGLKIRLNWLEAHHGYYGIALMVLGYALSSVFAYSIHLYGLGALLFLDDLYQHYMQVSTPNYHSPIHRLYGDYLYRIPVVKKLNMMLDKLLGRI